MQRTRLSQLVHLEAAAARISGVDQPVVGGARDFVLWIVAVVGPGQHHLGRAHIGTQVVDVTVGLVVQHALAQPDDHLDVQVALELRLDLRARESWIAVGIEQAFLGGDHRALPVHVDRAALEDEGCTVALAALDLDDLLRHRIVAVPGKVEAAAQAAPGVELPVDAADAAAIVDHEGRADVAHPRIVAGEFDDAHRGRQQPPRVRVLRRRDADAHRLAGGNRRRQRHERLLRRLAAETPVVGAFGPQQPAAGVRLELARHAEAVATWIGIESLAHPGMVANRVSRACCAAAATRCR